MKGGIDLQFELLTIVKDLREKIINCINNDYFKVNGIYALYQSSDMHYKIIVNNELILTVLISDINKNAQIIDSLFYLDVKESKDFYYKIKNGGYDIQLNELLNQKNLIENRIKLLEDYKSKI